MKSADILKAMEQADEKLIEKALPTAKNKSIRKKATALIAAVLTIIIIGGICVYPFEQGGKVGFTTAAEAEYPVMSPNPDTQEYFNESNNSDYYGAYNLWLESRNKQTAYSEIFSGGIENFLKKTITEFANDQNDNFIYSPLSLYFALGMLAELTDSSTRQEILDLLGYESIEELRQQANALWNMNYCDDGLFTSVLASSLWLNKDVKFNTQTIKNLQENYYSSTYLGEAGSNSFNEAVREWINDQTGGNLKDYASDVSLEEWDALALITTVLFEGTWTDEFDENKTTTDIFHGSIGDSECLFMNDECESGYFYWGNNFSAISRSFEGNGKMWFILPDEDVSINQAINDEEVLDFILNGENTEQKKWVTIDFSLPKFDISSSMNLSENLKNLGISRIFDSTCADFTPTAENTEGFAVNKIQQSVRITVNEKGCTASAFTHLGLAGSSVPDEEVNFILNRPFIFVITNVDGLPMFVGTVNNIG